jgi:hypothetical protein
VGASQSNPDGGAQDHTGPRGTRQREGGKGYGRTYTVENNAISSRDERARNRNDRGQSDQKHGDTGDSSGWVGCGDGSQQEMCADGTRVRDVRDTGGVANTSKSGNPKTVDKAKAVEKAKTGKGKTEVQPRGARRMSCRGRGPKRNSGRAGQRSGKDQEDEISVSVQATLRAELTVGKLARANLNARAIELTEAHYQRIKDDAAGPRSKLDK